MAPAIISAGFFFLAIFKFHYNPAALFSIYAVCNLFQEFAGYRSFMAMRKMPACFKHDIPIIFLFFVHKAPHKSPDLPGETGIWLNVNVPVFTQF